jgi:hypothetical protein
MCAFGFKRVEAITDITFGGARYSVCAHHRDNPIANPRTIDVGPAPSNGTATSDKAARETDHKVTAQCYTVLGVVAEAGPAGIIREEIYPKANITNSAACGRLNTLEALGLIFVDGERRSASTRKTQQVYRLAIYQQARAAA